MTSNKNISPHQRPSECQENDKGPPRQLRRDRPSPPRGCRKGEPRAGTKMQNLPRLKTEDARPKNSGHRKRWLRQRLNGNGEGAQRN